MKKLLNLTLCGEWTLWGRPEEKGAKPGVFHEGTVNALSAKVPGNIELALYNAGIEPEPFHGTNSNCYRKYECFEWCFEREFTIEKLNGEYELTFDGIDCFGTVYLNGKEVGQSHNAMIPATFSVAGFLREGKNTINVHLASPVNAFKKYPLIPMAVNISPFGMEHTRVRRPAHCWGWDILPRLALGGIFRGVTLKELPKSRFIDWSLFTCECTEKEAHLRAHCKIDIDRPAFEGYTLRVKGVCGDSVWEKAVAPWSSQVFINIHIANPKLWWPKHYGKANLYHVTMTLTDDRTGEEMDCREFDFGVRAVRLVMKDLATKLPEPDFQFVVNGVPVRAFGLNHIPCDALHSRDGERMHEILKLAVECDLNILRIWGGGVPETDEFYSICDREGIMIWHDFMFGCAIYPADREFLAEAEREAIEIVRARRHHACIALWAGDNECDTAPSYTFSHYADPNTFKLTREILPNVCRLYTPSTPYLPSSPYVSPACFKLGTEMGLDDPALIAPEQHIWGSHEYFKSKFYQTDASFVSETGYFGSPSVESLKKFLSPECLWPWDNEEWYHHASNPFKPDLSYNYRIRRLPELVQEYFGFTPDNVEDFALASQICQAEANKYFVERGRLSRKMSGMTIWNLIDGWPHFSDAIVGYYFDRKISYWYCRRDFGAFLIAADEAADWHRKICFCNDSNERKRGHYKITEFGKGILAEGSFDAMPRSQGVLENFETPALNQGLLLIEWTFEDGTKGVNHVVMGLPRYDFKTYRDKWLPAIAALDNSFDPKTIAK